jgi:hypothetical protein
MCTARAMTLRTMNRTLCVTWGKVKKLINIHLLFAELLVKRHYGVLGLSALIEACPYSVPEWLPEVIEHVASHNHDPAPIRVSGCNQSYSGTLHNKSHNKSC